MRHVFASRATKAESDFKNRLTLLHRAAAPGALHLYVATAGPAFLNSLSPPTRRADQSTAEVGGGAGALAWETELIKWTRF